MVPVTFYLIKGFEVNSEKYVSNLPNLDDRGMSVKLFLIVFRSF